MEMHLYEHVLCEARLLRKGFRTWVGGKFDYQNLSFSIPVDDTPRGRMQFLRGAAQMVDRITTFGPVYINANRRKHGNSIMLNQRHVVHSDHNSKLPRYRSLK